VGAGTKAGSVSRQSCARSEARLYEESCSRRSRTLGGVTLQEKQDSRRSHTLRKVALRAQPDPSRNDYGEARKDQTSRSAAIG
jgi:hypothetical protein